ncbi:hypothetical protein R3P38DRAFT_2573075, partial [Favolaschia claudopus]
DADPYLRRQLGIPTPHPINLYARPDPLPGTKPRATLPVLIKLAIYGNDRGILTLQQICGAIRERFRFFWEQFHLEGDDILDRSIRHVLSLKRIFKKIPPSDQDPGQGWNWALDVEAEIKYGPYKRERKCRCITRASSSPESISSPLPPPRPSPTRKHAAPSSAATRSLKGTKLPGSPSKAAELSTPYRKTRTSPRNVRASAGCSRWMQRKATMTSTYPEEQIVVSIVQHHCAGRRSSGRTPCILIPWQMWHRDGINNKASVIGEQGVPRLDETR